MATLKKKLVHFFFITMLFLLAGCSWPPVRVDPASANESPFIPPTLAVIVPVNVTAPTPTLQAITASTQANCDNNLTWLDDLNYPDGTQVKRNSILVKEWLVRNSGSCTWSDGYQVRLISGSEMNANPAQALIQAIPGTEATVSITFIAPSASGVYRSAWQAFDPAGQPFGDPIFIEIVIVTEP